VALPEIPRAPRSPRLDARPESAGRPHAADEQPSSSMPTLPPPPAFTELRKLSGHPSPLPPPPHDPREDARNHDSRSFTLPGPHAVPRLAVDPADLSWFEISDDARGIVAFVDGTRTITRIAEDQGIAPREAQLRIADLRARGIVEL
jgi:hypothetical protein